MGRPDVTVVIVNFNSLAYVRRCLASLRDGGARGVAWDVVVVDNASAEPGVAALAAEFDNVRVIRRTTNGGFAAGANTGIRAADAPAVLLINPDAVAMPGAVAALRDYLAAHPDAGIVAPRIEDPDGTLQLSCRRFPTFWAALFNRYSALTRLLPGNHRSADYLMTDWDHRSTRDVDWVSGAAMLIPRAALDRVGLFDEGYFFAIEDVDLCRRMHDAGLRVVYHPAATVRHRIGGSSRTSPVRVVFARHRGMWRYYKQHLRGGALLDLLTATGIALRCAMQLIPALIAARRLPRTRRA